MKILRTASLGSFLVVLIKKSVPQKEEGNHYSVIQGVLYRSGDATCFFFIFRVRVLLFTNYQNKTFHDKFSKTKFPNH